ncbi:transketolase [Rhodovulum iodosum]|uniref:Transketolase n=1 Tax=Rhodovulum iodosum TaxID=68291 RepID=A0ABV3XWK7_9RHOB|nr:transketolase [Rhodovulum robiginosum]RSK33410.1 transketolase [Rhodovulum robiginosum]
MEIQALAQAHPEHWRQAAALRTLALDAVAAANSGHTGMPLGMADIATVLFGKHLKFDAAHPDWPDRDRFVLSNGHGSMLLYGLLYLTGSPDVSLDEIKRFRQLGSVTAGHPEYGAARGIETTTGPLGQGLANAVGMAIAEEMLRARFGKRLVDHRTWVFAGDGCLMEGVSQEAITLAGRQALSRLVVFWDHNGITIDGAVALADRTDQIKRFESAGWSVYDCDGHDPEDIDRVIGAARASDTPTLIACRTHIGYGTSAQDTAKAHGALTETTLIDDAKAAYGWDRKPFDIPPDLKAQWEEIGRRGAAERLAWEERRAALSDARRREFARVLAGEPPKRLSARIKALKKQISDEAPKLATRKGSEHALEVINPVMPETVGGSADLTGSNNTKTGDLGEFSPENRKGRYLHFGIREHGMAAAMNGLALHGGLRPYGGTFLVFSDYARAAIRLSSLMGMPVTYVLTHDSIGLGEDGPTHQPVEQLASLRAQPNLNVFRPADTVETAEAWELALTATATPSVLALSRQGLPTLRTDHKGVNLTARGAYVIADSEARRRAILLATGSEVAIAVEARAILEAEGIGTRVVSMPCWEIFEEQDEAYRKRILPGGPVRVAVEAAIRFGWDRWLYGERGKRGKSGFVGMHGFGASAPADELYRHFGITAEAVAEKVRTLL